MADEIDELTEKILVDAYGIDEELGAFRQAIQDGARFPVAGRVVGVPVEITEIDYGGDGRRELVAVWRREGERYRV